MSAKIINFVSWPDENGIIAQCCCDTAAELPAVNAFSTYGTLAPTSTCRVINESSTYQLNTAGVWKKKTDATSVALDLSGYYTIAEVDSAISAALASYTTTNDMNTAINTAIMSTQYINRGTELPNTGADLDTLTTPGKYFTAAYANMMTNLPSTFAGLAFVLVVDYTTTTTGSRCRQTLYPAAAPSNQPVPHFWQRYMTGSSVWRAWVDFSGTIL